MSEYDISGSILNELGISHSRHYHLKRGNYNLYDVRQGSLQSIPPLRCEWAGKRHLFGANLLVVLFLLITNNWPI